MIKCNSLINKNIIMLKKQIKKQKKMYLFYKFKIIKKN